MISLKKRQDGFTIVELLIVIVVIGILAAIVITTYSGIQSKGRNTKRTTDVTSIQNKIEAYNADNRGYYPTRADLNNATFLADKTDGLGGFDKQALYDPTAPDKNAANPLVANAGRGVYAYNPTTADGASCEADRTTCVKYTLTATYEGQVNGETTVVKTNLN